MQKARCFLITKGHNKFSSLKIFFIRLLQDKLLPMIEKYFSFLEVL